MTTNYDNNTIYGFWVGTLRYKGYITGQNDTHFIIYDIKTQRELQLPKANTVIEEVKGVSK